MNEWMAGCSAWEFIHQKGGFHKAHVDSQSHSHMARKGPPSFCYAHRCLLFLYLRLSACLLHFSLFSMPMVEDYAPEHIQLVLKQTHFTIPIGGILCQLGSDTHTWPMHMAALVPLCGHMGWHWMQWESSLKKMVYRRCTHTSKVAMYISSLLLYFIFILPS